MTMLPKNSKPLLQVIVTIALTAFISSCTFYKKPATPNLSIPTSFKNANKFSNHQLDPLWWKNFKDPELDRLVTLALKNNLSSKIALKNIQIARTYVVENASGLFPEAGINFSTSRENASINNLGAKNSITNLYQLNGTVAYEVDVWGKVQNSVKQAKMNFYVSIADSNIIKLTLISNVANTYWQTMALDSNIKNLSEQLWITKQIVNLYQNQYKSGLIDIQPLADAKTQMELIKTNLNTTKKQLQILDCTLAYLVGAYPENFTLKTNSNLESKNLNTLIPVALPSKIMINRPDIQGAFYQVLSYGYAQKQSLANFFPDFSLTGAYGFASTSLASFTTGSSVFWSFGGNIVQTLFDFAKRAGQYKRARLQYESAVLNYKNTVINAFKEVENALVSYQKDYQNLKSNQNTLENARNKFNAARAQYHSGFTSYINYLEQKLVFLQSKYDLTNQIQIVTADIIQVYKTMGLGV